MKETSTKTLELLKAALAPTEEILRNEYARQLTAQMDKVLTELAEDGWDACKRYDYPSSSMSRVAYVAQVARYNLCNALTKGAKPSRGMHEPNIRVVKEGNFERIAKQAAEMARAALEGFAHKLAGKIDATGIVATEVKYSGGLNPWGFNHVYVNGNEQVWRTKMIINVSCLGKLFNQWPTRLVK